MEALSRWHHPKRGLLEARDYIPLAEETGLSLSVDALALDAACREAPRWRAESLAAPPLVVFVNVSVKELHRPDFLEPVEQAPSHTGTDPSTLCLEIEDSTFLNRSHSTIGSLLALKGLGLRLAVDDFGRGYASVRYRRRFPIDYLKLDASIVAGIAVRPADSAVVPATVNMAHALGLTLIAKGVENRQQLDALSDLGCDQAQGYHLAPPQPPEQLDGALSRSRRLELRSALRAPPAGLEPAASGGSMTRPLGHLRPNRHLLSPRWPSSKLQAHKAHSPSGARDGGATEVAAQLGDPGSVVLLLLTAMQGRMVMSRALLRSAHASPRDAARGG